MSLPSSQTNVPRDGVADVIKDMLLNQDVKKITVEPENTAATSFTITPFGSFSLL